MKPDGAEPAADDWVPVLEEDLARPGRPPAELLRKATASLAQRHGVAEAKVTWSWGPARPRPHSHLQPLRADLGDGTHLDAWYKVTFVPRAAADGRPNPVWVGNARNGIRRGARAGRELARRRSRGDAPGFTLPETLAAQPEALRVVMTSVAGEPLGKAFSPRPSRLLSVGSIFRRLGSAVRTLEGLAGDPPPLEEAGARARLASALNVAVDRDALPAAAHPATEARLERLFRDLEQRPGGAAWVHGDLSGSNVLVSRAGDLSFVDVDWRPRLEGFDVATYSIRLQLERPRLRPITNAAVAALLAGYGDSLPAGFLLERSQRWLRLLAEGVVDASSRTGARVIEELAGGRPHLPRL